MGIDPENDVYEAGVVCPTCESALFYDITPKYVELTFSGLVECPDALAPPPNGTWLLTQYSPCHWRYVCLPYIFDWILGEDYSTLTCVFVPQKVFFWREYHAPCLTTFANDTAPCNGVSQCTGGTGIIHWGPGIGPQSSFVGWEVGDPCCICESKIFSGFTPRYVDAEVKGIIRCPAVPWAPPFGHYLLTQIAGCTWQGVTDEYTFTWTLAVRTSNFEILEVPGGHTWFHRTAPNVCSWFFLGEKTVSCLDLNRWGYLGEVTVTWGPDIVP